MSIDPKHLRNVLALASDHLSGRPLPVQSPQTMAGLWSQVAALENELPVLEEAAKAATQAAKG